MTGFSADDTFGCLITSTLPDHVHALGLSRRKRAYLRQFLGETKVTFPTEARQVPTGGTVFLWGSTPIPPELPPHVRVVRLEDGFLRSAGLGADLVRPLSWVMDSRGIYYDATRPSDLEYLLQTTVFPADLLHRAARLRQEIVEQGLTKYNVGKGDWKRRKGTGRLILVPGQVESDASIRYGAAGIRTNRDLLEAVRGAEPDAHIVYKPHPDVAAGLRAQGRGEGEATRWCDEVVTDVSMAELLSQVDAVHLLTSLTGFESLLRRKEVVCYGHPFYAGWGLTRDLTPVPRRTRRLTLDELVAGALLLYPRYVSRITGRLTTPEQALEELAAWSRESGRGVPLWRRAFRVILRRVVGVK